MAGRTTRAASRRYRRAHAADRPGNAVEQATSPASRTPPTVTSQTDSARTYESSYSVSFGYTTDRSIYVP
jgi:hypothetical protein